MLRLPWPHLLTGVHKRILLLLQPPRGSAGWDSKVGFWREPAPESKGWKVMSLDSGFPAAVSSLGLLASTLCKPPGKVHLRVFTGELDAGLSQRVKDPLPGIK